MVLSTQETHTSSQKPVLAPIPTAPGKDRYQALATGHVFQLAVHILQVHSQCLLGLQSILTLGFTLLQLDQAGGREEKRRGLVTLSPSMFVPSSPARTSLRQQSNLQVTLMSAQLCNSLGETNLVALEAAGFEPTQN